MSMMMMRYLGEIVGTAILVSVGCMGCVTPAGSNVYFPELHFGLVVMIVMHCFGFVSGGHANPAITVACCVSNYISYKLATVYIIGQFLGALIGYFLLVQVLPSDVVDSNKLCLVAPSDSLTWDKAMLIEFTLTLVVILGWCALWDRRCSPYLDSVSLRVGFLVTACIMGGGQWTGASMNPARTFGPAVYFSEFDHVGIYFAAEFAAGLVGPLLWKYLFSPRTGVLKCKDSVTSYKDSLTSYKESLTSYKESLSSFN